MDLGLKGRVAIVAASSKGLGKAVATELAREGASLAICARNGDTLAATATEIRDATGVEVLAVPTDVTRADEVARLVEQTVNRFGRIDVLVNNAGGPPPGMFMDVSVDDFRRAVDLNLMSTIMLCKEVVPHMLARKWGRIINVVSSAAIQPLPALVLSNAVRPAVLGLAKTISNEHAKDGITVNSVCPAYTETERVKNILAARMQRTGESEEEARKALSAGIPMGRMGRPEEFAAVVTFLASERASFVTGTVIPIDGGEFKATM